MQNPEKIGKLLVEIFDESNRTEVNASFLLDRLRGRYGYSAFSYRDYNSPTFEDFCRRYFPADCDLEFFTNDRKGRYVRRKSQWNTVSRKK